MTHLCEFEITTFFFFSNLDVISKRSYRCTGFADVVFKQHLDSRPFKKALNEDARPPKHAITCLGKVESPSVVLMSRRAKDRMDKTNLIKKHGQNHAIKNSISDLLKRPTVQKHTYSRTISAKGRKRKCCTCT